VYGVREKKQEGREREKGIEKGRKGPLSIGPLLTRS